MHIRFVNLIGIFSIFSLFALLAILVVPANFAPDPADALDKPSKITLDIKPVLSLTASNVVIDTLPDPQSIKLVSGTSNIKVVTNASYGHSVSFSSYGTDLVSHRTTIPASRWGYTTETSGLDTFSNFTSPVPTTSTTLVSYAAEDSYDVDATIPLTFGIQILPDQTPGSYVQTIQVTAVTNAQPAARTIFDISTMQEMTTTICNNTPTPAPQSTQDITFSSADNMTKNGYSIGDTNIDKVPKVILTDTRESGINAYPVRKLADGNCWMGENLRLGSSGSAVALTAANSDFNSDYRKTNGMTLAAAQPLGTDWTSDPYNKMYYSSDIVTNSYSSVSQPLGGYYTWYTAVAYSGTEYDGVNNAITAENMPNATIFSDSICPKGWQLPNQSWYYYIFNDLPGQENKTIANLKEHYRWDIQNGSLTDLGIIEITSEPILLPFSGFYNPSIGAIDFTGGEYDGFEAEKWSFWWTNLHIGYDPGSGSSLDAGSFLLYDQFGTTLGDNGSEDPTNGYPIRCVAR